MDPWGNRLKPQEETNNCIQTMAQWLETNNRIQTAVCSWLEFLLMTGQSQ